MSALVYPLRVGRHVLHYQSVETAQLTGGLYKLKHGVVVRVEEFVVMVPVDILGRGRIEHVHHTLPAAFVTGQPVGKCSDPYSLLFQDG